MYLSYHILSYVFIYAFMYFHILCCHQVLFSCTVIIYCVHVLISYTVFMLYFHITFTFMLVNTKEVDTGNYEGPEGAVLTVRNSGL